MIQEIYEIGKLNNSTNIGNMEDSIIPDKLTNIDKVICINLNQEYKYINVTIYGFDKEKQYLYLMRKGAANGTNYGPTSQITEIEKTLKNKIIAWFKDAIKYYEKAEEIVKQLEENEQQIKNDINELILKKEKYLLTVCIDNKFPYQNQWILDTYSKMIKSKIFGDSGNIGTCYLCKNDNVQIVPEYGVYKFYTKDKPGFISGGFKESDFWRNFPVCVNCQPILNKGKQFIEQNLKYRYYGLNYFIIPSTIEKNEGLEEIISILSANEIKNQSMSKDAKAEFEVSNENIVYTLRDVGDINSFRLVFIEKSNSAERILLDIKDVYPSRFKQMYEAKNKLDRDYRELMLITDKDKNRIQIKFNFSFYREFLSKSDDKNKDNDLNKIFLELTQTIFNKDRIKLKTILPHYMRKIRRLLDIEDERYKLKTTTLKAIMGIQFLILVDCLENRKEENMETRFEEIFQKYNCGLDTDIKRALVLVGALVQKVMNIQYRQISSTPFVKNLKSLQLRDSEVKGLIAQCVNKMQEYNYYSNRSKEIVQEISKLIFNTNTNWKLSVDEINFYIVAGMALQKEIYGDEENKEEEDNNE